MSEVLTVTEDGPVRIVTLNRPEELNAVNGELQEALGNVWRTIELDPGARAVVITGAGKAFSAGGDFKHMMETNNHAGRVMNIEHARRLIQEMIRHPLPIVSAINGPAVGLGCTIAALSDIVYISNQTFIADPHVLIGLVAGDGGAALWPLYTSMLKCKEYLLTGDRIPAALAVELGLANRVVAHDQVVAEARALAHRLSNVPQQAMRDTKRALNMHIERTLNGTADFALYAERESLGAPEHQEFLAAQKAKAEASS